MDLFEKAARSGVNPVFTDGHGHQHQADPQALSSVIEALSTSDRTRLFNGPYVARVNGGAPDLDLSHIIERLRGLELQDENGAVLGKSGSAHGRLNIESGLYRLSATDIEGASDDAALVVAPAKAFEGDFDRLWLLAVQLYGIRSERNWGIGDFTDLKDLLKWAAQTGAAGIGLSPLHVLFDDHPQDRSPYSPNSRLFLNPIYIDVERLPELPSDFTTAYLGEIEKLREAEFVDYAAVARLKDRALRVAFDNFKSKTTLKRKTDFNVFCDSGGRLLSRFACFEVLRKRFSGPWWDWPQQWREPDDIALAELRRGDDAQEIEFVEFKQWCADRQLSGCTELATTLGMSIGLYLDVAVGVKCGGFDAWNEQSAIARQLSIGAPPDQLNTAGQDWGLAGYNATGLEHRAFAPFREMLRASMRYAGAVRLDHVLGLNRLYVVPHGFVPSQGVYIQMPFEAMLAVVALESVAHRCIVIGEDLGTVPEGFRERLADWGIWSYRVMMFERDGTGNFFAPDSYPKNTLVTFTTHDLPTFAGWRNGHDLAVKRGLHIDPGETEEAREEAVVRLSDAINDKDATFDNVLGFLSSTPSRLLCVCIEDLLGVVDQANVPGTVDQHPNWRRRLASPIQTWNQRIDLQMLRKVLKDRASGCECVADEISDGADVMPVNTSY